MRLSIGIALLSAIAAAQPLAAQGECLPGSASHEAKTMALLSLPLVFSRAGAPELLPGIRVGLEGAYVPHIDAATATPTFCRPGKGPEDVNRLPALPRPRLALPLPFGLAFEASWVPPIRVNGVRANLIGLSLDKTFGKLDGFVVGLRGYATLGSIRAPVTCPDRALVDPLSECSGGTRSDDGFQPNILGADVAASWPMVGGRLLPYAGAGYNRMRPRFQVNFTNRFNQLDDQRVSVDLDRMALFGGLTWRATPVLGLSSEIYAVPSDAVTARIVVRRALVF
ncbi:MAG TPA: hypothetical protein VFB89_13740 [Gemmatimonadales bacterium]|nr:hypothetical protein [Gemmatimonadales bacterium]